MTAGAAVALAGCGGSSSSGTPSASTTTTTATTQTAAATTVNVTLGGSNEFALTADRTTVSAGTITFNVTNAGSMVHEMVIVPAPDGADALKKADGEADETGSPGEVPETASGKSGSVTVTLEPGKYILVCNLPGHFAAGMWTNLTVT